jgi:hypothetical protein
LYLAVGVLLFDGCSCGLDQELDFNVVLGSDEAQRVDACCRCLADELEAESCAA